MKKFWQKNKRVIVFIFFLVIVWRGFLFIPYFLGSYFLQQRPGFIGPISFANFDGVHYLSIAQNGYFQYEQAFFPLFPLLIRYVTFITFGNYVWAGIITVYVALFLFLFVFYKLLLLDFNDNKVRWILVTTLFFPTAFFFGSVYTESLFLLLIVSTFYAARKRRWVIAGVCVGLASATKFVGIFLLPAVLFEFYSVYKNRLSFLRNLSQFFLITVISLSGVVSYMIYLWKMYGDPIFFIHAQPAFGANRSGGELIFLPQVLYRYIKIFFTVPFSNYDAWIALLEFSMLFLALLLLCFGFWQRKIRSSYIVFSLLAIIGPTLTGSLSSIPRYTLVAFPIFIILGIMQSKKIKIFFLIIFSIFFILLTSYFLQGYFIA